MQLRAKHVEKNAGGFAKADLGRPVYGVAALLLGAIAIGFGDFVSVWQPVPDLGGKSALVYLVGLLFISGGAATLCRPIAHFGGAVLALIFFVFGALWFDRVYNHAGLFGVWAGVCEQWATAMGGLSIFASFSQIGDALKFRLLHIARVGLGLCALAFGISHLSAVAATASLVPAWFWPGQDFWAEATGAFHMLAGLAILTGVCSLLAARFLALMMAGFGIFVWLPKLFATPTDIVAWGGNAVNLGLVAAAWVIGDQIRRELSDKSAS